jgi:peptidoglycan/LPS O-acetylase OafA/YrhL
VAGASHGREHLPALTGIRFFAAMWVLVFHTMPRTGLPWPLVRVASAGYLGVSLFFVLSGFILAHVYGEAAVAGGFPTRVFLRARFARVYPAYVASLLLAIPLFVHDVRASGALHGAELGGICVATLSMMQAWVPGWGCAWNCPAWSLSAEAFFYLCFPLIAPWLLRRSERTLLAVACISVAVLFAAGTALGSEANPPALTSTAWAARFGLTPWTPLVRLPEFILGICAARLLRDATGRPRLGAWSGTLALIAIGSIAVADLPWQNGLERTATIAMASCVLIAWLADPSRRSVLGRPTLVRLGNASYALYLLHTTVHAYFLTIANRAVDRDWAQGWTAFALYVMLVVGLSLLLHDRLELPARRFLRGNARTPTVAGPW